MTTMELERRAAKLELREVEVSSSGRISAIAVPYNTRADIGWFTESHLPGSFAKSIKEAARSLPLHVFHDDMTGAGEASSWPVGVAEEWDDNGEVLRGVWKFDDSEKAQRARRLATPDENGNAMLGYMSIRFQPIRSNWEFADDFNPDLGSEFKDHVDRIESRLVSVALVSTPAFIGATVDWVRSAPPPGRDVGRAVDEWSSWLQQVKGGAR